MAGLAWYLFGGGLEKQAAGELQDITDKVARDLAEEYNIVARRGTAMDRCVQAGFVAASYLQAKDETSYTQWKVIESRDCREAGVPR
jgi:hypothetical protein